MVEEMHATTVSEPLIALISIAFFSMDITMKGKPKGCNE